MVDNEAKEIAKLRIKNDFPELCDDEIDALINKLCDFTINDARDASKRSSAIIKKVCQAVRSEAIVHASSLCEYAKDDRIDFVCQSCGRTICLCFGGDGDELCDDCWSRKMNEKNKTNS